MMVAALGGFRIRSNFNQTWSQPQGTRGFSLVEVLLALVILSFVAVAVYAALLKMLTLVKSNEQLALASILGQEYAEKLARDFVNIDDYLIGTAEQPTVSVDCVANFCSAEQMASYEKNRWLKLLNSALLKPQVKVYEIDRRKKIYAVLVAFDDYSRKLDKFQHNAAMCGGDEIFATKDYCIFIQLRR